MSFKFKQEIVDRGYIPICELVRFKGLVIYGKLTQTGEWDSNCYVVDGEKIFDKGKLKKWLKNEPIITDRESERLRVRKRYQYLEKTLPKLQKEFKKLKEEL